MNKLLSSYIKEKNYSDDVATVIRQYEKEKAFYKLQSADLKNAIKDCKFKSASEIVRFVKVVNQYCVDYEREIIKDDIGKRFDVSLADATELICTLNIRNKNRTITPDDLDVYLSYIPQTGYKFAVLALFEGIGSYTQYNEDIIYTKASGINKEAGTITLYSGHTFHFSRKLINLAIEASHEDFIYDTYGRMYRTAETGTILRIKQRSDSSYDNVNSYVGIVKFLNSFRKRHNIPEMTQANLAGSGFYNAVYERLGTSIYRPYNRNDIMDILERYNHVSMLDTSIANVLRKYRVVT